MQRGTVDNGVDSACGRKQRFRRHFIYRKEEKDMQFRKILSLLLAVTMLFSCVGITAMAEDGDTIYTWDDLEKLFSEGGSGTLGGDVTDSTVSFADFNQTVYDADGVYDGKGETVVILKDSERNYQNNKTAQFFLSADSSWNPAQPLNTVSITGVTFRFADDDTTNDYTSGEVQVFEKNMSFTDCVFDGVSVSPWGISNDVISDTAVFERCTFKDLSGRYGVHQNRAAALTVTDCIFENCERGIHTNSTAPESVTVTKNTFTGIGDGYGVLCLAENGDYTNAELNITGNTAEDSVFLRQLNATVTYEQVSEILDTENNTYKTAYVSGSTVPEATPEPVVVNAYVAQDTHVNGWTTVWGQLNISGTENFYIEIYSGETYLGKTTLVDAKKVLLNGAKNDVTWHAFLDGSDSWWNTEWEIAPVSNLAPTNVKYYVDDVEIGTGVVKMSSADDLNPVVWEELRGVKTAVTISGTGTQEDPYLINNLDELKWFRDDVNIGNDYSGKYIKLTSDIDLNDEEWTPIAYSGKTFKGNFDGGDKTVKNLKITKELTNTSANNGIGFFGRTDSPATICNLTIENVDITGSLYVGAVVGYGYTGKKIENCTVKGNITIDAWWYAGVIGGNGYMNLVNNCHVIGNSVSYIKGNNGSYIGGIWGFRGEGGQQITNCTVSGISITGVDRVGGISGIAHYGNEISDCSASNVNVEATDPEATTVGLIVGACQGTESEPSVFKGNTVENVSATVGNTVITSLYGTNINGTIPVTNFVAEVNGVPYETFADAMAAAQDGDTVKLVRDAALTEEIKISKDITIDGNGKTITQADDFSYDIALFELEDGANVKFENVTFDGIRNVAVMRSVHADVTIDNCVINNCEHTQIQGLLRLAMGDVTITNTQFLNNECTNVITFNYDTGSVTHENDVLLVENCTFENNTCNGAGIVHYNKGASATIKNSNFIKNTLSTNGNAATVYFGFNENCEVSGCTFEENSVSTSHTTTKRVAGAIFGDGCTVTENAFINNVAIKGDGASAPTVTLGAYYYTADISANYWNDGSEPVEGVDYVIEYSNQPVLINTYYATYKEDGTLDKLLATSSAVLPNAEVTKLGAITVTDKNGDGDFSFGDSYWVYDLLGNQEEKLKESTEPIDINIAMQFVAKDTVEEAAENAYAQYTTDFFITIDGLADNSFVGNGCYLVGYYPSFGTWVKIPLDGFTVEDGVTYPVITGAGFDFKYVDICGSVEEFLCGIYLTEEVLEANPDINVNLALGLAENMDAALATDFVEVHAYDYTAEDFASAVATVTDAEGNVISYTDIQAALKALTSGATLTLLEDITIDYDWDCRNTGAKITVPVTIDGDGHTLKFTSNVNDSNWNTIFRFEDNATVKNLTIDVSEAAGVKRVITSRLNITADNVNIIGGDGVRYGIIFGEGAGTAISDVAVTITNSKFTDCQAGVSDNANGQDAKSVAITDCTFTNASVIVSAYETATFTSNTMNNGYVDIRSYSATNVLGVNATGNTLATVEGEDNQIIAAEIVADEGFLTPVAKIGGKYYITLAKAISKASNGDTITLLSDIALNESVVVAKELTLDLAGKTITGTDNNTSGNFYLISVNKGNLTVTDSVGGGKITLIATTERNWSASSVVIANNQGTLIVNNGAIEHLGGTSMAYGIDTLTNGNIGVATTTINGGSVDSTYFAVRQFANSTSTMNTVVITGGDIGYVWMQSPNNNVNTATTTINGGMVDGLCVSGVNADYTLSALASSLGESKVYGTMPAGKELTEANGTYSLIDKVELFEFEGASPVLGNSLEIDFYVAKDNFNGEGYYAVIEHDTASGVKTKEIPMSKWSVDKSGNYYVIEYFDITAKQITESMKVTIYDSNRTKVSVTREDGIKAYAERMLTNPESSDKLKTTLVDMLNYGAAAQKQFNYRTDMLANANLTDEQQAYASEMPTLVNERVLEDESKCAGSSLVLRDNILLDVYFSGITEGMYAEVKYTKHSDTEEKTYRYEYDEFETSGSYKVLSINTLVIADAKQLVTITVYDKNGNVYTTYKDSMNSYLARQLEKGELPSGIYGLTAKFTASSYKALH